MFAGEFREGRDNYLFALVCSIEYPAYFQATMRERGEARDGQLPDLLQHSQRTIDLGVIAGRGELVFSCGPRG